MRPGPGLAHGSFEKSGVSPLCMPGLAMMPLFKSDGAKQPVFDGLRRTCNLRPSSREWNHPEVTTQPLLRATASAGCRRLPWA